MPQLKPTQVIDLLRKCSITHICAGCPLEGVHKCDEELMKIAAEVIEELGAAAKVVEELISIIPRWISVDERLPDEELAAANHDFGQDSVQVLVVCEGANLATALEYSDVGFTDEYGDPYRVVKWMPMPGV